MSSSNRNGLLGSQPPSASSRSPHAPPPEDVQRNGAFLTTEGVPSRVSPLPVHVPDTAMSQSDRPQGPAALRNETPQVPTEPHREMPAIVFL